MTTSANAPIVIIGSGMAGYTLAREFRKLDADTPLSIISRDDASNYAKPTLSNALTAGKTPEQIPLGDREKMQQTLNASIMAHTQVTHINTANQSIQIMQADGTNSSLNYSKLVLAQGADCIKLPLTGNAADSVLWVNNLADYTAFRKQLASKEKAKVAIIGAGLIGCEFANDLINAGHTASVIDLAEYPLSRLLPDDVAEHFAKKLSDFGVAFHLNTSVTSVTSVTAATAVNQAADDTASLTLSLANGDSIAADILLSAVGLRPHTALAEHAGIHCEKGVLVNQHLETSAAHVFAIGDCAEVAGHVLPYVMPLMQQARALAKTLAGEKTAVHYPAMPVGVKTPAAPLVVLPVPASVAEKMPMTWSAEHTADGMIAKASDAAGTLQGFVLLGKEAGKQRMALAKLVPDLLPVS